MSTSVPPTSPTTPSQAPPAPALSSLAIKSTIAGLGLSWGGFIDGGGHTVTGWIMIVIASLLAVLAIYGRMRATGPVTFGRVATEVAREDERGTIAAGLALLIAGAVVVVGLGAFLWGCAATDIRAETEVHPYFDPGPPCLITVDVDGHRVHRTRWGEACPLDMPTPWLCARLAEKAPGAKLPDVCTP